MAQHLISTNQLYLLSGPSASGKSSFTKQLVEQGLPEDAIVSTDTIRKQILGSTLHLDEYGVKETLTGWDLHQNEIFNIIYNIVDIRLKQKLTTIIDATNLNDETRKFYVDIGKKHGISSKVIIFDIPKEELEQRLSKRKERFDFSVVEKQLTTFQKDSVYPFILANMGDEFILTPNLLMTTKVDVLGDTHGLLSETIVLLGQRGWEFKNETFVHPDPERKILFLGDIVDRGLESIPLLKAVYNTVNAQNGYLLLGNHEAKLISAYELFGREGLVRGKSLSNAQTLIDFLALDKTEQENYYQFLKNSPVSYSLWLDKNTGEVCNPYQLNNKEYSSNLAKIGFIHADVDYYNPFNITFSHALYGRRNSKDMDSDYEKAYLANLNDHILIRGHVTNTSEQNHVYSLEEDQAFSGYLVNLPMDAYTVKLKENNWESTHNLFKENSMKQKSEFNYNDKMKDSIYLIKELDKLNKDGLVSDGWKKDDSGQKIANPDGLKIYKYSKKVHFKRLWKEHPLLEKARGLVLDIAGNIVVHPFDKLYNYGEYDVGVNMKPEQKVQVIEKLNGFLGCISKHPFRNELLVSTTGSLTSDFIQYIKDFITPELENNLLHYFKDNKKTLMFEVIHPEDKHIIEYPKEAQGLWLIGARGLNFKDKVDTEEQLDTLGKKLNLKRPFWYEAKFGEVLESLQNSDLEGFMIRDGETQDPIMKIKTNYYLITKFLGRTGPSMIEKMFRVPEKFKEAHVEEEFYPIVDKIVSISNHKDFIGMEPTTRMDFVRDIVNELRNEVNNNKTSTKLKM